MRRLLGLLMLLVAAAALGGWLATRPAGDASAIQPSATAALAARAKVAAAFGAAAARAFITRRAQPARVELTDEELTSLAAARLDATSSPVSNPSIRGTGDGVFQAAADAQWQGWTFHVTGAGTVTFDSGGGVHIDVRSAGVGLLPLPASTVQTLADEAAASATLQLPPGITGLALAPVPGGGVLTGTAGP